jgi:hypothetical protein
MGTTEDPRNHANQTPRNRGCRLSNRWACEACNHAKQSPGWNITTHGDDMGCHIADLPRPAAPTPLEGTVAT